MLTEQQVAELQRDYCGDDVLQHLLSDWVHLLWAAFRGIDIRPGPMYACPTPLPLLLCTLDIARSLFPHGKICTDLRSDCESSQGLRGYTGIPCKRDPRLRKTQGAQCSGLE